MTQVIRKDGLLYYGEEQVKNIEQAYERIRKEHNRKVGRQVAKRLDRIMGRKERIHGFGFSFDSPIKRKVSSSVCRIPIRLLGLISTSYVFIVGSWDFPEIDDEDFDQWIDWILSKNSGMLKLVGKYDRAGRTSKLLNKHYK